MPLEVGKMYVALGYIKVVFKRMSPKSRAAAVAVSDPSPLVAWRRFATLRRVDFLIRQH